MATDRKRSALIVAAVAFLALVVGGALSLSRYSVSGRDTARDEAAVHALFARSLPTPEGSPLPLEQFRGRPLVLNFWASWCGPCVEEMPELSAWHRKQDPQAGPRVLGVAIDNQDNVQRFLKRLKVDYPLAVADANGMTMAAQFGNAQGLLPFTVVIGADGRVKETVLGKVDGPRLDRMLK